MSGPDAGTALSASFRDPSGSIFLKDGVLYRRISPSYKEAYDLLISSGLYRELTEAGLLIPHEEADLNLALAGTAYKVLKPRRVPFISYPYEWCFGQLKAAALATFEIQRRALGHGLSLKDASAYNIQFIGCRPLLIDTLSFEPYREGEPWVAYRQFCQHFLAPLALMSLADVRLGRLSSLYIDGIPLDLAGRLLPFRSRLSPALAIHLHMHAGFQGRFAGRPVEKGKGNIGRTQMLGLIDSLRSAVAGLAWKRQRTAWSAYYDEMNYSPSAFEEKKRAISGFLDIAAPQTVWDLGANTGIFSRIAAAKGAQVVSFDLDPSCVEENHDSCVKGGVANILPLVMDLANPSPAIGWEHKERASLVDRGPADVALALALVHHLAIGNNVPLERIALFFRRICRSLIIEFVPKEDPQVKRLLASREDIFPEYTKEGFETAFGKYFTVRETAGIEGTGRIVYLMSAR